MCQPVLAKVYHLLYRSGRCIKGDKVALHLKIKDSGRKQMEICVICFNLKEIDCRSDLDIRKCLS